MYKLNRKMRVSIPKLHFVPHPQYHHLSRSHCGLGCRTYSLTTRTKGLTDTRFLIKDAVAISTLIARIGAGHHVATGAGPANLGNIARGPNRRTIGLGTVAHKAAIVHHHAGARRVHNGPTNAGTLFNVVAGIEKGRGNIVQKSGGDDHHGTTILQSRANIFGEHRIYDVAE